MSRDLKAGLRLRVVENIEYKYRRRHVSLRILSKRRNGEAANAQRPVTRPRLRAPCLRAAAPFGRYHRTCRKYSACLSKTPLSHNWVLVDFWFVDRAIVKDVVKNAAHGHRNTIGSARQTSILRFRCRTIQIIRKILDLLYYRRDNHNIINSREKRSLALYQDFLITVQRDTNLDLTPQQPHPIASPPQASTPRIG